MTTPTSLPGCTLTSEHYPGAFAHVELDGRYDPQFNRLPVQVHMMSVILPGGSESGATLVLSPNEARELAAALEAVAAAALQQVPEGAAETIRLGKPWRKIPLLDRLDALSYAAFLHAQAPALSPEAQATRLARYQRIAQARRAVRQDVLQVMRHRPFLGTAA